MASGFWRIFRGLAIKSESSSTADTSGEIENISNRLQFHNGTSSLPILLTTSTDTVSNKTLNNTNTITVKDANFTLQDDADTTKQANFQLSGITAGQTRTLTLPDASLTVVGTATTQTLSNKTLDNTSTITVKDANFTLQDDADTTKQAAFQLSGITTGNTRTFTLPDASTTVLGTDATQVITNKDIDGGTAANNRRITLSKDTTANLVALTRKQGNIFYDTTINKPVFDDGSSLLAIGSGAGSVNYIDDNPDAESGTSGWSTYADAAQNIPVDGTGGAPNSTWTRTTTSPLRGSGSFLWTKSGAANRQGEGVAYAFTIDSADQAKPLSISFDYIVASGTFTAADGITAPKTDGTTSTNAGNSDLEVFIYDVTNSTLIVPAGLVLTSNSSTVPNKFVGTFQTASNSTSYRLIIHTATTTTNNFTVKFDNFVVGPQVVVNGAAVTDWVAFTPTGAWTTNTTYTGYWRRVGDEMEVDIEVATSGAPTAATLSINLPSGYTIDTAKLSSYPDAWQVNGLAKINDSNTTQYVGQVRLASTTAFNIEYFTSHGTTTTPVQSGSLVSNTAPFSFGASDNIHVRASFPISGWSSNVQMSNDTDTRVVAAKYKTSAAQSIADNTATIVDFGTKDFDTHGAVTTGASWKFTAPVSGKYKVSALVFFTSGGGWAAGEFAEMHVHKNGTKVSDLDVNYQQAAHTTFVSLKGATVVDLIAGDYIDIRVRQNSGGALALNANTDNNHVSIERISGPSVVAASETVAATYHANSKTGVDNTATVIDFASKKHDSHGAVTTGASWKFTAPISGKYQVSTRVTFGDAENWNQYSRPSLTLHKNGSGTATVMLNQIMVWNALTGERLGGMTASYTISLVAGDYIDLRAASGQGATRQVTFNSINNDETWVNIERIGN